ncbi:MAG: tetratricopeptide repeat protein [Burkholderiaceae bacterium]
MQALDFRGQPAAAREALQQMAHDSPGGAAPPRARLRLAEVDLHEQRLDAAASRLDALIAEGIGAASDQVQAKALRAEVALRQGDTADATRRANETLAELAARGLRWLPGVEPGLQLVLGEARCAQDPGEDAARPMRAAVQALQQLQHPDSPALAAARARLGLCLWHLGQRDEAAQLARQADAALRAHAALNADFRRPLQSLQVKLGAAPRS